MKVLVTGSSGFIGSHLVRRLLSNQLDVLGLDRRITDDPYLILESQQFIHHTLGSGTELPLDRLRDVECVIHLASETGVDRSITAPGACARETTQSMVGLLELCRRIGSLQKLIFLSTDHVAVDDGSGPFPEKGGAFSCGSVYAASMASQELLAQAYLNTFGTPVVIIRSANVFGPGQRADRLIPRTINHALRDQRIPIYGDGLQARRWVHVDYLTQFLNDIAVANFIPPGSVLHVMGTPPVPNVLLVHSILNLLGRPQELVIQDHDRSGHDRGYRMVATEETHRFGFPPYNEASFMEDLRATVESYKVEFNRKDGK